MLHEVTMRNSVSCEKSGRPLVGLCIALLACGCGCEVVSWLRAHPGSTLDTWLQWLGVHVGTLAFLNIGCQVAGATVVEAETFRRFTAGVLAASSVVIIPILWRWRAHRTRRENKWDSSQLSNIRKLPLYRDLSAQDAHDAESKSRIRKVRMSPEKSVTNKERKPVLQKRSSTKSGICRLN